ncbi:class I SAM-dependent methyltransferase [Piscinibacter aquaticus]|uniref:Class I SAM-dependent methyltransferase n=1 Tax=Piscinibacter aquaticus TaxID=392597 RepID=A0A5C6U312_9BURK|nr:class I SAM-dependent methyltransferase [Piscinibacter aquaticus]
MWDHRYAGEALLFGEAPNEYLRAQAACLPRRGRALCVADGEGRNSVWLAQRGLRVDAFDISAVGVAKARALAQRHHVAVNYAVADCDALAWPEGLYDVIAAIFVQFADPPMRERLFAGMARALAPGGLLVLQGYTPDQLKFRSGGPQRIDHLYTEALLREHFADLEILELTRYEAELHEGPQHSGMAALVGMVARKR